MTLSTLAIALEGFITPVAALSVATGGFVGAEVETARTPVVIPYIPTVPRSFVVQVAARSAAGALTIGFVPVAARTAIATTAPSVFAAPRRSIATVAGSIPIVPLTARIDTLNPGEES